MNTGDMTMNEIIHRHSGREVSKVKELSNYMTMEELIERSDERRSERRHQQMLKADDGYYEACLLAKVDERMNQLTQEEIEEAIVESNLPSLQEAYRNEDALQFGRVMINVVSRYWRPIFTAKIQESGDL